MFKKAALLILTLLLIYISPLFANDGDVSSTVVGNGVGIGSALAIAICWTRTNSVMTSILAGVFGWFYVIYYCIIIRESEAEED